MKPSLLPGPNAAVAANSGILARLEQGGGKDRPIFKTTTGRRAVLARRGLIMGLLGVLCAGVAMMTYQNSTPPSQSIDGSQMGLGAKSAASIAAPVSEPDPQGLAALIVNEPVVAASSPATEDTASTHAVSPPVAASPQPLALTPVGNRKPQHAEPTNSPKSIAGTTPAHVPRHPVHPASSSIAAARHTESSGKNNLASSAAQKPTKPTGEASKTQAVDKDVALLTALMAHGAAVPPSRTAENAPKSSAKSNPQSASATAVKSKERNRDIVERQPTDTTEALLQRCKQLGFFEGEFCRLRICSGRWGSDAACKVSQTSF